MGDMNEIQIAMLLSLENDEEFNPDDYDDEIIYEDIENVL